MTDAIVQVVDVSKTYPGRLRALDELSLTVHRGTIHGLLGPNGAGKTTLVKVLTTLLSPDSGEVRVAGHDVWTDPAGVRSVIGLAGQYAAVDDDLTGRENVEMIGRLYGLFPSVSRRRAEDILERIGLRDVADRLVRTYSGGMKRRLDLAASLVGRPQVLLLDEPTTGLDPGGRRDMWELIRGLVADGTTVLLTTQYLDEADQLAERIAVMDEGRVINEGSPRELKAAIGGATVEVTVDPTDRARLLEQLRDLGAHPHDDSADAVVLPAAGGTATLQRVIREIDALEARVSDIALRRPTLDDVFLSLTSHRGSRRKETS